MSDMIHGPIDPGNPDRLSFNTLEGEKQHKEEEEDSEEYQQQRKGARLASLGIDPMGFSDQELDKIVKILDPYLVGCRLPEELLAKVLLHYGHDIKDRNLPPSSHTVVLNSVLRRVLLFDLSGSRARDAVEAILQKHQVAAKNPFGL